MCAKIDACQNPVWPLLNTLIPGRAEPGKVSEVPGVQKTLLLEIMFVGVLFMLRSQFSVGSSFVALSPPSSAGHEMT